MNEIWISYTEKIILIFFYLVLIHFQQCIGQSDGFWSDNFENSLDCESKDEIENLSNKYPSQCEDVPIKNGEESAFSLCKTRLTIRLQKLCVLSIVEKPGDLMYCKKRGFITCCFVKHTCFRWYDQDFGMNNKVSMMIQHAKDYLKDKHAYLNTTIKPTGYKTCHPLDSLDASECAKDCERLAKEAFANNCTSNGGLFKCCIRRQRGWVDGCNFCCTLPMCTYRPGGISNTVIDGLTELKWRNRLNIHRANELFFSNATMWIEDYRCLKPNSHKDPKKWHTYELESYRKAYSPETLASVQSFPYNKYEYNFADLEVINAVTKNDENARKFWRKNGFYFAATIPGIERRTNGQDFAMNVTTCTTKCIDMENSKFAKYCHKKGGYFKCCVSDTFTYFHSFPTIRYMLIKAGLIKGNPKYPCKPSSTNDPCRWCTLDGICTVHNPLTGDLYHMFYPDKRRRTLSDKQKNQWDGPGFGDRFKWCTVLDICKYGTSKANTPLYDTDGFQEAASKEEVCAVTRPVKFLKREEKKEKDELLCSKAKTGNIFLCSDEDKKHVFDPNVLLVNDFFERKINDMQSLRTKKNKVRKMKKCKKTNKRRKRRNQRKRRTTRKGKKNRRRNKSRTYKKGKKIKKNKK